MNRQDFIFTLFDNGNGLTLDQIEKAFTDEYLLDIVPDGLIDDLISDNGWSEAKAIETAICEARTVQLEILRDTPDMIELKHYLESFGIEVTDMQVYHLWYVFKED